MTDAAATSASVLAAASASGTTLLNATHFFGNDDKDGLEKFKTIALRALYDQKIEGELKEAKAEVERLSLENKAITKQLSELQTSLEVNVDDRERVLAFKSKRIEELLLKVKDYEAINTSLLSTINGVDEGLLHEQPKAAGRHTRASLALLQRGEPLFHAVETCKENEYKRLLEEKTIQYDILQQQMNENLNYVSKMQAFEAQKGIWEERIIELESMMARLVIEKDDKIRFLEQKMIFEQDRLRRENEEEIHKYEGTMAKQMRKHLDETTQRTIEENAQVQLELRYQSTHLEHMVKHVDALMCETRQLRQEKQVMDEMNITLSKKLKFYEHLVGKLQHKLTLEQKSSPSKSTCDEGSISRGKAKQSIPLPSLRLSIPHSPDQSDEEMENEEINRVQDRVGDQLNDATRALDEHLMKREFSKIKVNAMIQHHQHHTTSEAIPVPPNQRNPMIKRNKNMMLEPSAYSTSSYPIRNKGVRKPHQGPLTLETFIQDKMTISPRNRTRRHLIDVTTQDALPTLKSTQVSVLNPHTLWQPNPSTEVEQIHTARF